MSPIQCLMVLQSGFLRSNRGFIFLSCPPGERREIESPGSGTPARSLRKYPRFGLLVDKTSRRGREGRRRCVNIEAVAEFGLEVSAVIPFGRFRPGHFHLVVSLNLRQFVDMPVNVFSFF